MILAPAALAAPDWAPFTEEAAARGIAFPYGFVGGAAGWGLAFGDLDCDGDPDLVAVGGVGALIGIWENDGRGHFTSRSAGSGVPSISGASSVLLVDLDGDGWRDILVGRYTAGSRLFRNAGGFQFVDVSAASGIVVGSSESTGNAAADVDGDGDVDVFLSRYGTPCRLYRNEGGLEFTEVGVAAGVTNGGWNTWQAVFTDIDLDGDPDLYVSNDKKVPTETVMRNRLYRNDGAGQFVDVGTASGAGVNAYSMGVALGDFDRNGHEDLYCANLFLEPGLLLLNQGRGAYVEAAGAWGVGNDQTAWGTVFFDWDNDGRLDLYVCNFDGPNRLYRNDGRTATDVAPVVNAAIPLFSHCIAAADIDGDGDIDLAVQVDGSPLRLLINHEGERRAAIRLDISGFGQNTGAIGTRLALRPDGTDEWLVRSVMAGGNGFKGQNETRQVIGIGEATEAAELVVQWPDGAERLLTHVPPGFAWRIERPERLGDADGDGDRDPLDFVAMMDCMGVVQPGCEPFDLTGDFVVDALDVALLLDLWAWPVPDCDGDGVPDPMAIAWSPALDWDGDGAIDACRIDTADIDGDGAVGVSDLSLLLAEWARPTSPADVDGDGVVGPIDLGDLLAAWSP